MLAERRGNRPSVPLTKASWIGIKKSRRMNCDSEMCQRSQNSIAFRDMWGRLKDLQASTHPKMNISDVARQPPIWERLETG